MSLCRGGALLATSQDAYGAQKAIKEYMAVSRSFGLTVSISKTKHMAILEELYQM